MTQPVKDVTLRRSTAIVALGTFISRISGMLRDIVLAGVFGVTGVTDAFYAAFRIPNTLRRLLAEGGVTVAVQPVYARKLEAGDQQGLQEFERALFSLGRAILLVTTAVGILAAPLLVNLFASGFADNPAQHAETIYLLRIMFPFVYFIGLTGISMGVLNARGLFFASAVGSMFLNFGEIAGALVAWYRTEPGGTPSVTPLAVGTLFGVAWYWWSQRVAMQRAGASSAWSWQPTHPDVVEVGKLLAPSLAGLSIYQLQVIVGTQFASYLPTGGFTCLWYADRLIQFPLALVGTAVGTVTLPLLSRKRARNEPINAALGEALSFALFLVLPAAAGLYAIREDLTALLFGWGRFGDSDVARTAQAVAGYSLALAPATINRVLTPVFYAEKKMAIPVYAGILSLFVQAGLAWLLLDWDVYGLALATAGASLAQFLVFFALVLRSPHRPDALNTPILKTCAATALMYVAISWSERMLVSADLPEGLQAGLLIAVGVSVFVAVAAALRHEELRRLWSAVQARVKR